MENDRKIVGFDIPTEVDERGLVVIYPYVETIENGIPKRELDKSIRTFVRYGMESSYYFDDILALFGGCSSSDIHSLCASLEYELEDKSLYPAERYKLMCQKLFWDNLIKEDRPFENKREL